MTTFAFVAGMIPLIVSSGDRLRHQPRDRVRRSSAGSRSALLLTLLVTPVAYSLLDDWSRIRLFRRSEKPEGAVSEAAEVRA